MKHRNLTGAYVHVAHAWEYADETAREAATGFTPEDVGKLALQLDTGAYFRLTDDDPITWFQQTGTGGAGSEAGVYASRPAAEENGLLYLPSDGHSVDRDTGAAWASWGPIYPFTRPVLGDFGWENQEGATATASKGGIYLLAPAVGSYDFRILKKAQPSKPYTITVGILPHMYTVNYNLVGLVWRQSADGKLVSFSFSGEGTNQLRVMKFSSPTAWSATYTNVTIPGAPMPLWLRIADDNTNRICSWSVDGQNFHVLHSVANDDYLTADEVGFFANSGHATYPAAMTLLSWKEA